jgi:hypothetical protein
LQFVLLPPAMTCAATWMRVNIRNTFLHAVPIPISKKALPDMTEFLNGLASRCFA